MAIARGIRRGRRASKKIEPQLEVWVEIDGNLISAGSLALHEDAGQFYASFTYHSTYLDLARVGKAFSLDPLNLPLQTGSIESESRYFKLGALFDAAPDAWGRTVMASDEGISSASLTESTVLLKGRGSGVGAILFAKPGDHIERPDESNLPSIDHIDKLYRTITAIESGVQVDERLREMLMSSWDMGGARPKAVVLDNQGAEWIVKFPRAIDTYSRQRNEWANLEMARAIGMRVPTLQRVELEGGDCALLIRRFDRGEPGQMKRQHYLSAVSLISPPPDFDKRQMDSDYGASFFSYARIADVIRAISSNVEADLQELFARMVLNILLHNTDDHLKNTGFLMDPSHPGFKYRLSPLFDVVTQEGTLKHMLHIGPGVDGTGAAGGRIGTLENARAGALHWGLTNSQVDSIIEKVKSVTEQRHKFYVASGMGNDEIELVERQIRSDSKK